MDYNKLRKDLIDYYGTAMYSGFPAAMMELPKIEKASNEELIKLAQKAGFDLRKYEIDRSDYER